MSPGPSARDSRPKVLMLATRVPLSSGDGTPSFILDSAIKLASEFEILIIAPRVSGSRRTVETDGVTIRRFAYFPARHERLAEDAIVPQLKRHPGLWIQAACLLVAMSGCAVWEALKSRPSLVHAQWIIPSGLIARLLHVAGIPYLVTARGADVFSLTGRFSRRMKHVAIKRSARFIGVSSEIVNQFPGIGVPTDVQPSGVDFRLWSDLVVARDPDPARVLYVGRLAEKKGVTDLIRAVAEMPGVRLRIVGDGPMAPLLRRTVDDLGILDRVDFLGRRSRAEVASEMRFATCIAIPSVTAADGDRDGTPNVLGEAIAARVPVVGARTAGIAELIEHGETGLLHEPGDLDSLKRCIRSAIDDRSAAAARAQEARVRLWGVLDATQAAERYANWYRLAIAEPESAQAW